MSKFHSKRQRKKVMRLVNQHTQNMKHATRQIQSQKGKMSREQLDVHIDKTEPFPKNKDLTKQLSEEDHDIFMKKAFFKGDKGEVIPKLYHSSTDENGKKWYQSSALEKKRHLVKGQGDFHYVEKFNTPYKLTKKEQKYNSKINK